jgi:hypothetical protein
VQTPEREANDVNDLALFFETFKPPPMTSATRRALRWLRDNGGVALIDRYGNVSDTEGRKCGCAPATFLRLVAIGHVAQHHRASALGITQSGLSALVGR